MNIDSVGSLGRIGITPPSSLAEKATAASELPAKLEQLGSLGSNLSITASGTPSALTLPGLEEENPGQVDQYAKNGRRGVRGG